MDRRSFQRPRTDGPTNLSPLVWSGLVWATKKEPTVASAEGMIEVQLLFRGVAVVVVVFEVHPYPPTTATYTLLQHDRYWQRMDDLCSIILNLLSIV